MSFQQSISTIWTKNMLATMDRAGVNPQLVCQKAHLNMNVLTAQDERVPQEHVSRIWNAAEKITGDPSIGLIMGDRRSVTEFHNVLSALKFFEKPKHSFQIMSRYSNILSSTINLSAVKKVDSYWLDLQISGERGPVPHHTYDAAIAWLTCLMGWVSDMEIKPSKVAFTHACRGDERRYRQVFGCPVEFESLSTGIEIPAGVFERSNPSSDALLKSVKDVLLKGGNQFAHTDHFIMQVRAVIKTLLPSERIKVAEFAKRFNLSARTFQRRLMDHGWSLRELIDDVRKTLAIEYVCQDVYKLELAAEKLGYMEPTSFLKSFKRWYGCTPGEYRRNNYKPMGHAH